MSKTDLSDTANIALAGPSPVPRVVFEAFIETVTHEVRNYLNNISLEATLLREQSEPKLDIAKLQGYVQGCAAYLKNVRDSLAPEDTHTQTVELGQFVKKLREKKKE